MAKTIITERDVEDLARRGIKEIVLTDDVYLTDVAREKAEKLGVTLRAVAAAPAAPTQPQLVVPRDDAERVIGQVKADVIAKLGPGVDAALIERIVRRVVNQVQK